MKTNKPKRNWLIDAALFIGLLLSFWLELTGVALHQWLGVAITVGAGYHLFAHWAWVKSVTARFFRQTSGQARLYYVIDAAVLIGLATITVTGLVISTWLDLALANFAAWKTLHVIASIGTLPAVVVKIGLHWRWIVSTARRYILPRAVPAQHQPAPVAASNGMGRREFLRLMGGVSAVAVIALVGAIDALKQTTASSTATNTTTQPATQTAASTPTPSAQQTNSSCVVRCNKGCSYPGSCRRYTDSNNNGRCDLGECVAA
jgi:hypothetical protein